MKSRGLHLLARLLPACVVSVAFLIGGSVMADGNIDKAPKSPAAKKQDKKQVEKKSAEKPEAEKSAKKKPAKKAEKKEPEKKTPPKDAAGKADEAKAKAAEAAKKKSDAEKSDAEKPEAEKPKTVKVERRPLVIKVELSGVFEAHKSAEIVLRPKQWSDLKVLRAVEHGATVQQGDPLVVLDCEKIDRQIADLRTQLRLKDLQVALAEHQLKTLETTTPMDMAAAERANRETQADLDYYLKTERPLSLKSADMMLKLSDFRREYAEEELRQLEKMYEADELTEETEEIILKRARFQAEISRFSHELQKVDHARMIKTEVPRRDQRIKESAKRAGLDWQHTRVSLPAALKQQRITLQHTQVEQERARQKLDELMADRKAMEVTAPIDGVVYYGQATRGKFSSADSMADDLQRGGSLSTNKVFMTVVQPSPVSVRATVPEKQLQYVETGLKGSVAPTGYPDLRLEGIVQSVSPVPVSAGSFEARLTVAKAKGASAIMPGMTCKVKSLGYAKRDALTLPPKAVGSDPLDDTRHFVMVVGKDGKQKKRPVTVGKRTAEVVEILKGLKQGDEVLAEYPNGK